MPAPIPARTHPVRIGPISDIASFNEPQQYALQISRGDAFQIVFRLCEDVTSDECGLQGIAPQTLDGYEAEALIRPSLGHAYSIALECTVDETAGSGRIAVSCSVETARALYEHGGVWSLELTDGTDDFRKMVLYGPVKLIRDIVL